MMFKPFFVVDTNCFISANLIKDSVSAKAFDIAILNGKIAISSEVLIEYTEVLYRDKLDKYLNENKRQNALKRIEKNSILFSPTEKITACRDFKDNKFLELALACKAKCIISGDSDLLILNPFRQIDILHPSEFIKNFENFQQHEKK
jgi:uncharacterized protein